MGLCSLWLYAVMGPCCYGSMLLCPCCYVYAVYGLAALTASKHSTTTSVRFVTKTERARTFDAELSAIRNKNRVRSNRREQTRTDEAKTKDRSTTSEIGLRHCLRGRF